MRSTSNTKESNWAKTVAGKNRKEKIRKMIRNISVWARLWWFAKKVRTGQAGIPAERLGDGSLRQWWKNHLMAAFGICFRGM